MKRFLSLFLALVMSLALAAPAFAAGNAEYPEDIVMEDVCIASSEDYVIVVSIPQSEAEAYRQRLETEPGFREAEIRQALGHTASSTTRELPPGIIDYQSYMYRDDIKKMVDAAAGAQSFDSWFAAAGYLVDIAEIAELVELSKEQSIFALAASILGTVLSSVQQKQKQWWDKAFVDIINEDILAVRYTVVQSLTEYPKAWLVYERI